MLFLAGVKSGCGKSTVTIGLMGALGKLGLSVQPFKAGPDFIDAGLHGLVCKRPSRNLDIWMCGENYVLDCATRHSNGADAAVAEGVMGLFDGGDRSTDALAAFLGANVVLVVDAYGMAESAAALVRGFNAHGHGLKGVIFNRVSSAGHLERLSKSCPVPVLGYLPPGEAFGIPSRHLGLKTAEEMPLAPPSLEKLIDTVTANFNMEELARLARPVFRAENVKKPFEPGKASQKAKLAVAWDAAFPFYYRDNLDMFEQAGAQLCFFSPLKNETPEAGAGAVYIGGGYPELYAKQLSANFSTRNFIKNWAEDGRPIYAECGGLMYLGHNIEADGADYEMCGVLPISSSLGKRPVLGYRQCSFKEPCLLGAAGQTIRGHEFHYSRIGNVRDKKGVSFNVMGEKEGAEISSALYKNTLATYTHVHFGSNPEAARNFVRSAGG